MKNVFGSLFMLLSILTMISITGTSDFDALFKVNFDYSTQILLFIGIFIAFAIKTPLYFLNSWLLKAHVESPLSGSIILAAITMAALNLANSWKHHVAVWEYTWSISRKLCAPFSSAPLRCFVRSSPEQTAAQKPSLRLLSAAPPPLRLVFYFYL